MSNEIKVGDKVRVREDAPKIFFNRSVCYYPDYIFEVREVEDGNADIYFGSGKIPIAAFVLPLKYLVKVDAEKKEAKFKVGDRVRVTNARHSLYEGMIGTIDTMVIGCPEYLVNHGGSLFSFFESELEPYTEPTEEKTDIPASKSVGSLQKSDEESKNPNYWDAYTADPAKEVALKVANKFNDPEQAADYAVKVAKAVVEGLKRK